jgi:hypothetical protein
LGRGCRGPEVIVHQGGKQLTLSYGVALIGKNLLDDARNLAAHIDRDARLNGSRAMSFSLDNPFVDFDHAHLRWMH